MLSSYLLVGIPFFLSKLKTYDTILFYSLTGILEFIAHKIRMKFKQADVIDFFNIKHKHFL